MKKLFFCSLLITEAAVEGPKCTGHMAHLTAPAGAAGAASPRSRLAALAPSPRPSGCTAALCWSSSTVSPNFLLYVNVFSSQGFPKLLPHSGPGPVYGLTSEDQSTFRGTGAGA